MIFSRLKQELSQVFNRIRQAAIEGEMPALQDVQYFAQLCSKMQVQAPESWAFEADDFHHLAKELLQCIKQKNTQDAIVLVHSLHEAQTYCHRTFQAKEG